MQHRPSPGSLFMRFLKLGCTAYGGPAMIGQIRQTAVSAHGWLKDEEFLRGLAFVQAIPGGTVPQMVAYVGYRVGGFAGALAAALGYLIPPFAALVVLSTVYFRTGSFWLREPLFKGLSAIAVAIVLNACLTLGKPILRDWQAVFIALLSLIAFFFRLNVVAILAFAALAALFLYGKGEDTGSPCSGGERPQLRKKDYCLLGLLAASISGLLAAAYLIDPPLARLSLRLVKIGALMFGGGYTVIPLIQYEVVDEFHWIATKEFLDGIALGQLTPGPMMITAFIGNHHSGLLGATVATVALMSPSFFMLILFLPYHDRLKGIKAVAKLERGILASFIGMLGLVLYGFGRTAFTDVFTVLLAAGAFLALVKKVGLPWIVLVGGGLSLLIFGHTA